MSTIERVWNAFTAALNEARCLHERGAASELCRHGRELLDIIQSEVVDQSITIPDDARRALAQLRLRLTNLEQDVMPTRH